ncbi:nuclear transport factor 2 family protein [Jiangella muralis]|uniref:nuclear transport factor 2 family protein n=1 Tax=Jiangella muralis TaxID=702383 RepID=UPI0009F9D14E|nr:nuclear transport factor 2 family protein [Jiangella muralis]
MTESNVAERVARLEERLRVLEDQRDIERLVYRYGYTFDDGDLEGFIGCFTEDCVGEYRPFAQGFEGKDGIRQFASAVKGTFPRITETFHFTASPVIDIIGDDASSRWHWMNPSSVEDAPGTHVSAWQFGVYEMWFRRESAGWKIRRNRVTYRQVFDVTKGYAGNPMLLLGSGQAAETARLGDHSD